MDLLLSYYGDDLTGSTDVMESLAMHGVETVLFLAPPDEAMLRRFGSCRAIGLAGTSRSETPDWMDTHLTEAFAWLAERRARVCHYKVCSTFDSSPRIGNIGRAIEIGRRVFAQERVPVVVGAPQLGRYTAFGHLFARFRDQTFRIDRHPVMSRHPVTPMHEADLRLHLAAQTDLAVGLVDLAALQRDDVDAVVDGAFRDGEPIILIDVVDRETQRAAGRQLARLVPGRQAFVVGSSGVEYALLAAWQEAGLVSGAAAFLPPPAVERIAVVSGSCSPTTERQIRHAEANGFDAIHLDPRRLAAGDREAAMAAAIKAASATLDAGRSPLVYTARGPESDVGAEIDRNPAGRHVIGESLGEVLRMLVARHALARGVVAGGDTSSHALRQLGVTALTTRLPLPDTPGSPLCVAHGAATGRFEVALKGGQIGRDDYFVRIRAGG